MSNKIVDLSTSQRLRNCAAMHLYGFAYIHIFFYALLPFKFLAEARFYYSVDYYILVWYNVFVFAKRHIGKIDKNLSILCFIIYRAVYKYIVGD